MRECLNERARDFCGMLRGHLVRLFPRADIEYDDIINRAFEEVIININRIENAYETAATGSKIDKGAFLYGALKLRAYRRAIDVVTDSRKRKTQSLSDDINSRDAYDGKIYQKPTGITWPEQEDVVFRKQLLETCGRLPPSERAVMRLTMDRATQEEIILELGISKSELIARRGRAMRHLLQNGASA